MSLVGLAHFIELTVLAVTFILLVRYWWRKCRLSLSDCFTDPAIIVLIGVVAFLIGVVAFVVVSAVYATCAIFMHMVFPDYTYLLIGA